jgi:hypothetical protein
MLTVRAEQLTRLEAVMLDQFELRLLDHVREHFPTHWRVIGAEQMRKVVHSGINRARDGGYPTQRDAFMFVSLMLYLGSYFENDPQYPWLAAKLAHDAVGRRSERLENAFDAAIDFVKTAAGANGEHRKAAYARANGALFHELKQPDRINSEYVLSTLYWLWPKKYDAVGEQGLRTLMNAVVPTARRLGIATPEGALLFVVAAFLLGHRANDDAQFPWLAQALAQQARAAPATSDALQQALATHLVAVTK